MTKWASKPDTKTNMSDEEQKPEEATFMDGAPEVKEGTTNDVAVGAPSDRPGVVNVAAVTISEHSEVVFNLAIGQTCKATVCRFNNDNTVDLTVYPGEDQQGYLPFDERGTATVLRIGCSCGKEVGQFTVPS